MRRIVCLVGCALMLMSCATQPAEERTGKQPGKARSTSKPGSVAQERGTNFIVQTFDGEGFALAEHRGTPVVLNFWESW